MSTAAWLTYTVADPMEWDGCAQGLLAHAAERRVWCLEGGLGAGKTTLVQALCRALGVAEPVTSPTFGLVHTYVTQAESTVYHADLYRLKGEEELLAIGMEEYLQGDSYCFVEWPSLVLPLLAVPHVRAMLEPIPAGGRMLRMQLVG